MQLSTLFFIPIGSDATRRERKKKDQTRKYATKTKRILSWIQISHCYPGYMRLDIQKSHFRSNEDNTARYRNCYHKRVLWKEGEREKEKNKIWTTNIQWYFSTKSNPYLKRFSSPKFLRLSYRRRLKPLRRYTISTQMWIWKNDDGRRIYFFAF